MKKVISLSKIFIKEFYQNLPIFDKTKMKFNKRSMFFWLIAIVFIGITYVSYEVIKFLVDIGQPSVFLNLFFPILAILLIFQTILVCANIFFFSKDIKNIMHMPLKPVELLLAKLNTLVFMLYITEAIFAVVPITLYGLMVNVNFIFYLWEVIVLLIFPIIFAVVISIILLIIMHFIKFIRNKDIFQVLITIILLAFVFVLQYNAMQSMFNINSNEEAIEGFNNFSERTTEISKYFLVINPSIEILSNPAEISIFIGFLKLIGINIIALVVFIFIGKVVYLKDVLRATTNYINKGHKKKNKVDEKLHRGSIGKSYIIKELKMLIREPIFFMQCVFPVLIILLTVIMLGVVFTPIINEVMQDETIATEFANLSFNAEILCYILIVMQVLFSISTISLTAVSREGKSAKFVKYIPINLYKQFLYKNVPQILLNMLVIIVVLGIVSYILPMLNWIHEIGILLIAIVINFINSYLMLIVDLRRPNLDWDSEHSVVKRSDNKIFQYVFMIINVIFLMYIAKIFEGINIYLVLLGEFVIYLLLFIIINLCVKKWQNKLFNKII